MTKALMLAPGLGAAGDSPAADSTTADSPILDEVADLIAAAVARHEALGLAAPLTAADYRVHLDSLLKQAAAGDAGLGVVLSTAGDVLSTA
ncbi:hypothetical protein, partial [Actinospica sp.]|uniref:hypothetical protein n=1 Tax=Actinospica sp. TaxID=1872142 RepID=UPI002CA82BB7